MDFKVGDRVSFPKAGRFPVILTGVISWMTPKETAWLDVKCDDGVTRRARPKNLTRI